MHGLSPDYSSDGISRRSQIQPKATPPRSANGEKVDSASHTPIQSLHDSQEVQPKPLKAKGVDKWLVSKIFGTKTERAGNMKLREDMLATFNSKSVELKTSDKHTLQGTLVAPKPGVEPSGKTYIFCSGSFGCYEKYVQTFGFSRGILRELTSQGHQVLLFDYRGFGENTKVGDPSAAGIHRDTEAAYQYMKDQGVADENIVMYGYSLGGTVAAAVAAEHPVDLLLDRVPKDIATSAKETAPIFLKNIAHKVVESKYELSTVRPLEHFKGKNVRVILEQERDERGEIKDDSRIEEFNTALRIMENNREGSETPLNRPDLVPMPDVPHIFQERQPPSLDFLSKTHFPSENVE